MRNYHEFSTSKICLYVSFRCSNKFCDGLKKKSHTFVPPQNAVPFSDEWLAAIEAAGEVSLTASAFILLSA